VSRPSYFAQSTHGPDRLIFGIGMRAALRRDEIYLELRACTPQRPRSERIFDPIFLRLFLSAPVWVYVVVGNRLPVSIHIWVVFRCAWSDVDRVVEHLSAQ
jgi:hypothetical protein